VVAFEQRVTPIDPARMFAYLSHRHVDMELREKYLSPPSIRTHDFKTMPPRHQHASS
jgi:hypothetical protein